MKDLLERIIEYIENTLASIDCRSIEEIIKDGDMPKIYFEIKRVIGNLK
jgi:hypothetical protein